MELIRKKKISEKERLRRRNLKHLHFGFKHTNITKDKIRQKAIGRKYSKKSNDKKGDWSRDKTYNEIYGKDALLQRQIRSDAHKGEKCHFWKDGRTELTIIIRNCFKYRLWRSDIFTRDNFTCQSCFTRGCYLEAHHYPKRFSDIMDEYNIKTLEEALNCEELWSINNGQTICRLCHDLTKRK